MRALLLSLLVLLAGCLEDDAGSPRDATDDVSNAAAPAAPPADVDVHESHDLTMGLPETTWSFDVVEGSTSHIAFIIEGFAVPDAPAMPKLCIAYKHTTASSVSTGQQGECAGAGNLAISISGGGLGPRTILDWSSLDPGHHEFTASTGPQANRLLLDIVVDNSADNA